MATGTLATRHKAAMINLVSRSQVLGWVTLARAPARQLQAMRALRCNMLEMVLVRHQKLAHLPRSSRSCLATLQHLPRATQQKRNKVICQAR